MNRQLTEQHRSLPRELKRLLRNDPRIENVIDAREDDDGYHIFLIPPYWIPNDVSRSIHEMTVAACVENMNEVRLVPASYLKTDPYLDTEIAEWIDKNPEAYAAALQWENDNEK